MTFSPSISRVRARLAASVVFATVCLAAAPLPVCAQRVAAQTPAPPARVDVLIDNRDANLTREQLRDLLQQYPPSLREVLRLDPSLLSDEAYLAPYPALAAFLASHPEVVRNPAFFIGQANTDRDQPYDVRRETVHMWQNMFQSVAIVLVFAVVAAGLAWLIRALLDYRRWLRVSKVQVDAHSKLLDRLTSNEDLLAYIQTTAGRRFLESAPLALDGGHPALSAPLGRILWSLQAGVVLTLAGGAMQYVSRSMIDEVAQPVYVFGVLVLALGMGFILSAVLAYLLSRHLGLFPGRAADAVDGRPGI